MSAFKNRKELVVFKVPYFSTIPWSSAFIPLCFKDLDWSLNSIRPEMSSPLKKVGKRSEWSFLSINLCLWRPLTSSKIILQIGFLKKLTIFILIN